MSVFNTAFARATPAMTRAFGDPCVYTHLANFLDMTLIVDRVDPQRAGRDDLLSVDGVTARGATFRGSLADFSINETTFTPEFGDEVTWTDPTGLPLQFVVFPRTKSQCFDYSDQSRNRLEVYTVERESLSELLIQADGIGFTVDAILATPRTNQEQDLATADVTATDRTRAFVSRFQFPVGGVGREMLVTQLHGNQAGQQWTIDLDATRWGADLVELGLMRTGLLAMGELRRGQV